MPWTRETITIKLREIRDKGFIPIPAGMHRTDDGIVGQILEREFAVAENNLSLRDLGTFELKGIRKKKKGTSNLTLSHKRPERGLSPIEIFHRFGYIRVSNRDANVMKKKLFVTVNGRKPNPQGLMLRSIDGTNVDMIYRSVAGDEFICEWNLTGPIEKMDQIILGLATTQGTVNSAEETFHYEKALLLDGLRPLNELIDAGVLVIEFCIDQPLDANLQPTKAPHDRGPHIRVSVAKLKQAYNQVTELL